MFISGNAQHHHHHFPLPSLKNVPFLQIFSIRLVSLVVVHQVVTIHKILLVTAPILMPQILDRLGRPGALLSHWLRRLDATTQVDVETILG